MSIVARGGVVYGFYMEQSSVDFGYISPLKSKYSPQGSGLYLCSGYSKHNYMRPSSDPPSSQGISGWGDEDNREDTSYRSHLKFPHSTHTHIYILPAALILPKYSVVNVYLSLFKYTLQKIRCHPVIAWLQCRSWLAKMGSATNVSYSVGQRTHNLSHDPRTLPLQAAQRQQGSLSGG